MPTTASSAAINFVCLKLGHFLSLVVNHGLSSKLAICGVYPIFSTLFSDTPKLEQQSISAFHGQCAPRPLLRFGPRRGKLQIQDSGHSTSDQLVSTQFGCSGQCPAWCEVLKHGCDAAGCQKLLEEKTDLQGEATSVWQPQSQLMLPGQQPSEIGKGLLA